MQSYKELIVWQRSIELVKMVYELTKVLPKSEQFGITNQMRRAATSIPANIAEGYMRKHRAEYIQFVRIAFGSGAELETFLIITEELGYVTKQQTQKVSATLTEVMKMLNGLLSSLVATP
jgi:four helix bundle protein